MNRWILVVCCTLCVGFAAAASAQTLRVTADRTNVRDKASTDGSIVVAVSKGDELEVLDRSGNWYHVRVKSSGAQGYVNALVVEVAQGAAGAASPATPSSTAPATTSAEQRPGPQVNQVSTPTGPAGGGDRKFFIRPFGGLWTGYSATGFGGGLGVALRPFPIEQLELEIDGDYAHQSFDTFAYLGRDYGWSQNMLQFSGNAVYNFKLPNLSFTPFAGLGLQYTHESINYPDIVGCGGLCYGSSLAGYGFSGIGFQFMGGIELPINDSKAWRFQFREGTGGLMLLGGISF